MRPVEITTPPAAGTEPPDKPVPPPRATMGMPAVAAIRTQAATSAVVAGTTTISGRAMSSALPSYSYIINSSGRHST